MPLLPASRRGRTTVLVAAALVVAALVAGAVVQVLARGADADAEPKAPAATPTATARVTPDNQVHYTAADGQTNKVLVTYTATDGLRFTLHDDVRITAGAGCVHPDASVATVVTCTVPGPDDEGSDLTSLVVSLGDGDDRLMTDPGGGAAYTEVFGGAGDDVLLGGGRDVFYGGPGDDRIDGGGGAYGEGAHGGPGDDVLTGCDQYCHP